MTTPRVRIAILLRDLLGDNDLAALAQLADLGIAGEVTVRHTRRRYANPEEGNSLSIRVLSDEPRGDAQYHTVNERLNELAIDLIVDTELPAEDSELDPTGLEAPGSIANAAIKLIKSSVSGDDDAATTQDGRKLSDLCDDVVDLGMVNDDDDLDNGADEARFIHRILVLYRTATEDPNILLAAGENL